MDKVISMEVLSRPVLVMLVALILLLFAFAPQAADQGQACETPPLLLGAAATAEGRPTQPTWVDDLEHRLGTYFKTKYPRYDFGPYVQELDRVRAAVGRGDQRTTKLEMGVFLKMLATRAYGLGSDAADEVTLFAQRVMPAEEYGIIFPGSETEQEARGI